MKDDGIPWISQEIEIAKLLRSYRKSQDQMIHMARCAARASREGRPHGVTHCERGALEFQEGCAELASQIQRLLVDAASILLCMECYGDIPLAKRVLVPKQTIEVVRAKHRRPVLVHDCCRVPVCVAPASFGLYPQSDGRLAASVRHGRLLLGKQGVYLHRVRTIAVQGTIPRPNIQGHLIAVAAG